MANIKEVLQYVHAHGMPKKGKILMVASSSSSIKSVGFIFLNSD